jgi:predicted enzyme related to lactoylglutathione lyase
MANTICYFEIMVGDVEKAKAFYTKVFDWKIEKSSMQTGSGPYYEIRTGAPPSGGLMKKPDQAPYFSMSSYVLVDSVDETLRKAVEAGGKGALPKMEIPTIGWWGMFFDPDGIPIMVFEPLKK